MAFLTHVRSLGVCRRMDFLLQLWAVAAHFFHATYGSLNMDATPIGQIEEAIFLLRRQDMRSWLQYLLGAVPFYLALLAFVHDMSAGYLASRCAIESLGVTLAYLWASAWKAKFGGSLLATMNGQGLPSPQASLWHALHLQIILQTIKLIAFPFAIISILPIAWTSGFFRNAAIEASMPDSTLRSVILRSARRSGVDARSNWVGVSILTVLCLLTFVNIYISVGMLPYLVRTFTGFESLFTRGIGGIFSFDIFCIVLVLTWFVFDPLVLSYCVIRCFYSEALTDGRDLLAKLRPAVASALLLLFFTPLCLHAETVSPEQLSSALRQASKSDEYGWLRARNKASDGLGDSFFKRLGADLDNIANAIKGWFDGFGKWLRDLLQKTNIKPQPEGPPPSVRDVHWLLYAIGALVLVAVVYVLLRNMNRPAEISVASTGEARTHDLNKENVLASDLPEEEWLRMARKLLAQGEPRLAVRAMYLSNLSYLGAQRFIQVARAKSNAIYERELRLRPHSGEAALPFAQSNRNFERAWYGFHEVTPEFVELFQQDVEAIRRYAKA